ncbi:uncharacterized protein V6R79_024001 [Siganus canaliculatus]
MAKDKEQSVTVGEARMENCEGAKSHNLSHSSSSRHQSNETEANCVFEFTDLAEDVELSEGFVAASQDFSAAAESVSVALMVMKKTLLCVFSLLQCHVWLLMLQCPDDVRVRSFLYDEVALSECEK